MIVNMFPKKTSIVHKPPRELFTGVRVDYSRNCKLGFGDYVQVYAERDDSNNMHAKTVGAICLGSTGNLERANLFYNLLTNKVARRRTWIEMPMRNHRYVK
jgi:hypothetical protein